MAKIISEKLTIPVLGWGSGPYCDGVGLNICDIIGLSLGLSPKFAKEFADLHDSILNALNSYKKEIQEEVFPTQTHSVHMDKTEYEKLLNMI